MTRAVNADYLVVGAGAMGMAFTDALIDHADVRVALVDRRHGVSGHWLEAYPFVRLHQASAFYGVSSTLLGGGQLQQRGPEEGLQERATQAEICTYYARMLERMVESGKVEFFPNSEHLGDRTFVSRISGESFEVPERCRVVDARYLAPSIPAEKPPPFAVEDRARVVPVNALARLEEAPSQYVVVGSGKTATDSCIWLLSRGVDPDAICWVRPRDPWMTNRGVVQPDPAIFLGMVADTLEAGAAASSPEDLFLRLEDAGIMVRIDRSVMPTMAKAPTLATWELEQLRTIQNVVRRGHIGAVGQGKLSFADGTVRIAADAVVVHCAADGLKYPPQRPVWAPEQITPQPIRAGFPCFGAALTGYVEATRRDDDEKNRLCPSTPFPDTMESWIRMTVMGGRAAASFGAEADIKEWASQVALNPARIPPGHPGSPELDHALERMAAAGPPGMARMAELVSRP
ncbi:pyridine nucleotide-disulfide oxidoreductase [Nocardioides humilatus]|uniref:Pyridine nucleotide-disulfide oxidoreductase n=1 Tax=Nocardioides humilatus TaxID=2607660 RepID=A0A5B1L7M9_9ACTN|nr:NAD(P)-binding protein [Nocardioides humilatus]KAA1416436.1 pyridine nucleotide-disulfide oxidoreductase [Nocardioides humilatus]